MDPTPQEIAFVDNQFNFISGPGASVVVVYCGKTIKRSYGKAVWGAGNTNMATSSLIRLSSNTKAITAMAILTLVSRNAIGLNDRIGDIFDNTQPVGEGTRIVLTNASLRAIRVKDLLRMESGLTTSYPDGLDPVSDYNVVRYMNNRPAGFFEAPGTRYRYINANYAILAVVAERASGVFFENFVQTEIFNKLRMNKSLIYSYLYAPINPNLPQFPRDVARAFGYRRSTIEQGFFLQDDDWSVGVVGDGTGYTSAVDYEKWLKFWFNGAANPVLQGTPQQKAALMQEAKTPGTGTRPDGSASNYGFGWHVVTYNGEPGLAHGGTTGGFRSSVEIYPAKRHATAVLMNRRDEAWAGGDPTTIRDAITAHFWNCPVACGNGPRAGLDSDGGCACVPQTCNSLNKDCGTYDDGCGGTVDCGTCPGAQQCNTAAGVCQDICVPTCAGKLCGSWPDGCNGTVDCGTCDPGETCDQTGECECISETCESLGRRCGTASDGCGLTLDCGLCGDGGVEY